MKRLFCLSSLFFCYSITSLQAQTAWEFDGATAPKGWSMINYQNSSNFSLGHWNLITPATPQAAYIRYQVSTTSSQINTEVYKQLKINIKNETSQSSARFYFWYKNSPVYIPFELQPNSDYTEYTIDLANSDAFSGNGTSTINVGKKWKYNPSDSGTYLKMPFIRFDIPSTVPPEPGYGVLSHSTNKLVSVDYIRFVAGGTPQVTLAPAPSATSPKAYFNNEVTKGNDLSITERGLLYSIDTTRSTSYKIRYEAGTGIFSHTFSHLTPVKELPTTINKF